MKVTVVDARVEFVERPFIRPLKLSSGTISQITEAQATVRVLLDNAREPTTGVGSIYLSDLWAWPEPALSHEARDRHLRNLSTQIASSLPQLCGGGPHHPTELGLRLHESIAHVDSPVATALARAMCASPFDAAIHDATGIAMGCSALDLYDQPMALPSADRYFDGGSAMRAIRECLQPMQRELLAWWIVGPDDPLDEEFGETIARHGYRCFKLKIRGRDNAADVKRTCEVFRAARNAGIATPRLSVDSNEANPDADSVLDYLERLRASDRESLAALAYLEQPTARDIRAARYDWHAVAAIKPVMLDEGLTSLDLLAEAKESGWSGLALKTCKGHSFLLAAAAWAHQNGMLLSMQDLTNPGYAAIHAALVASRLNTINGVELNSPQFTPAANSQWMPRLKDLFEARDGVHRLPPFEPTGLGSAL